jgi:type VI secretion system protein ImpE
MNASTSYKAGRLQEALDAQVQEVKKHPADPDRRVFLFELAVFAGDLDRARRQLDAASYDEPERAQTLLTYRRALDAEVARRRFFREGVVPKFLTDPPEHARLRLEAASRLRQERWAEAAELLGRADAACLPLQGLLNGKPFTSLRDADDLFASVLEMLINGAYYWVPLEQIDSLAMNAPQAPRDLFWFPARLQLRDGNTGEVFLPALYPGSHEHADDLIKLGRTQDWLEKHDGLALGRGTRLFLVGEDDVPLLDWRELHVAEPVDPKNTGSSGA